MTKIVTRKINRAVRAMSPERRLVYLANLYAIRCWRQNMQGTAP